MGHLLTIFFAMIFSFGHGNASHRAEAFVPPSEFVNTSPANSSTSFIVPVSNRDSLARRNALNSYSEDACLSCRSFGSSTPSNTSQPQLLLRAPR